MLDFPLDLVPPFLSSESNIRQKDSFQWQQDPGDWLGMKSSTGLGDPHDRVLRRKGR